MSNYYYLLSSSYIAAWKGRSKNYHISIASDRY